MAMRKETFDKLAECIRECGKYIQENAEALAPNVEMLSSMEIRIAFDPNELPTVNVDYDVISIEAAKAWTGANKGDHHEER